MTIHILPQAIRQRIAAGEVVERPASAVKELVENSIDAGARAISVEVLDGGLSLIRVADDGCGMDRADAQLCVERFSTSKLHALSDLDAIRTLGFRGEALSSIVAVAQVEILTRTVDEIAGTRVYASEDAATVEPAASPVGTSVTVRGLFAQVPARRRFLKSRTRETELIQNTVDSFALAYPEIAFRLIVDDRERLVAPHATRLARVGAVLGRDVAGEMIALQWQALDLSIEGFISRPTIGRSRRSGQYFFVNGRPIRPGLLAVMLERPYSGRLPPGRHPLAVVYISLAPSYVDVNVHPRKSEVRFAQERTVYGAVASAVSDALHEYPRNVDEGDTAWPFGSWPGQAGAIHEGSVAYSASELRALAQLHNTYILAQTPDGLAIVDQHAAHEQVLFEHISRGGEQVALSPPARLHLTPREADTLERIAPLLEELGIEVEPFGGRTFLLRSLPASLGEAEPNALLTALIAEGARQRGSDDEQRDRLAMEAACQCAVKAGDPLTDDQMQQLLDDLAQAWSPATCPHGRPALVALSLEELAQRFGR